MKRSIGPNARRRGLPLAALLLALVACLVGCSGGGDDWETRLYVTQTDMPFGDGRLHVYGMPSLDYLGSIGANKLSARMATRPGGREIWVSGEASFDILVLDTAIDSTRTRFTVGAPASGGSFDAAGERFLLTHGAVIIPERSVPKASLYDVASRELIASFEVGADPRAACFAPDGRSAYVANTGDGTISVLDLDSLRVSRSVETGAGAHHLAIDPSGRWLYVACLGEQIESGRSGGGVWIHSLPGLDLLARVEAGLHPSRVTPNPSGDLLVVSEMWRESGEAARVRLFKVGSGEKPELKLWREVDAGKNPLSGGMSRDGRYFAAPDFAAGRVTMIDLKQGRAVAWINLPVNAHENFSIDAAFARCERAAAK